MGPWPSWARVRRTEVRTDWASAPAQVRLPPHTLRLTMAGRQRRLVPLVDGVRRGRLAVGVRAMLLPRFAARFLGVRPRPSGFTERCRLTFPLATDLLQKRLQLCDLLFQLVDRRLQLS